MYGQTFDCELVVLGPAADIARMESRLTALSRSVVGGHTQGRSHFWDRHPGWPSDSVERLGQAARGCIIYRFQTWFYDPCGWVQSQAVEWPRLSFRAHYRIVGDGDDDSYVRRDWLTSAGLTRSEGLFGREAAPFWGPDGFEQWLAEAGFSKGDRDATDPSVVWSSDDETRPAVSMHDRDPSLDLLEVVREAIADGTLGAVGPLVLSSGTKLYNPEAAAEEWLEEAANGTWIAEVARRYLASMMAAVDANGLGRHDEAHAPKAISAVMSARDSALIRDATAAPVAPDGPGAG